VFFDVLKKSRQEEKSVKMKREKCQKLQEKSVKRCFLAFFGQKSWKCQDFFVTLHSRLMCAIANMRLRHM